MRAAWFFAIAFLPSCVRDAPLRDPSTGDSGVGDAMVRPNGVCATAPRELGVTRVPFPRESVKAHLVRAVLEPRALTLTVDQDDGLRQTYTVTGPFEAADARRGWTDRSSGGGSVPRSRRPVRMCDVSA